MSVLLIITQKVPISNVYLIKENKFGSHTLITRAQKQEGGEGNEFSRLPGSEERIRNGSVWRVQLLAVVQDINQAKAKHVNDVGGERK